MGEININQILDLLVAKYGNREWQPAYDSLSVLIQTILSQNTSDINSWRAFRSLKSIFADWEDVANADIDEIAFSIKAGGLGKVKANYIKQTLHGIKWKRGKLDLDFLDKLSLSEAREWLIQLPGVGAKTANCVLLFSSGRPALPVDTHIYRVAKRLGLIDTKASVHQAHVLLEDMVSSGDVYRFHVLMIEHGRKICHAQRPRCSECVLRGLCPAYDKFAIKSA
ncbi:endonuclease III domain-containing protein [Chloroflexota bacterium]